MYKSALPTSVLIRLAILLCFVPGGCVRRHDSTDVESSPTAEVLREVGEIPIPGKLPDGGKTLVMKTGWHPPEVVPEKSKEYQFKAKTRDGREVSVKSTFYQPIFGVLVEPVSSEHVGLGPLAIQAVKEYKVKNRTFACAVQVNRVEIDPGTNAITSSHGSVFFFTYYDEDGDGTFETLALDERGDKFGHISFALPPHVPNWVL